MHIKNSDISRELRAAGVAIRTVMPYMKESTFRKMNKGCALLKGHGIKGISYEQVMIEGGMGEENLRLCIYGAKEQKEKVPGILRIHGGGYCLGAPEQSIGAIKAFVKEAGCVVVAPDYTLAASAPYPAALNDCYCALKWMKENANTLNIKEDQIFVGGESAGGGLAAALCICARDKKEISVAFQLPLYPMLDDRPTASSADNDAPLWNTRSNEAGWRLYLRELYQREDLSPYAAAGRLTDFTGLPPAFTFIGDIEPFRDEVIHYFKSLKKAGIPAKCYIFHGAFHGFDVIRPGARATKKAYELMIRSLKFAKDNYFKEQPR